MAKSIMDEHFQEEVLESKVPVLVDFFAAWCGPCRMLSPIVDEIATTVGNKAKCVKMDVDECNTAKEYGVTSIPTVIIFEKGEVKETFVGVQPPATYLTALGI